MALQMEVDSLELKIESSADGAAAKVDALTAALASLKKTARVTKGLSDVADLLERINKFSGANLNINLDAGKAKEFSGAMKSITKESRKSEDALKDVNKQTKIFGTSASSANLRALISDVYRVGKTAVRWIGGLVKEATDYVETINLAQVAMKDYFAEAEAYANRVNDKLGVDPAAWLKTQATFMAMGTGFGFTEDKAYKLSKALTELSYDISSLYNEDIETATQRLQSAFAGEIEPIRRLGISISQATLEEFALSKGITESVSAMTEQEKSLLRTLKIIEDSKKIGAVGDLARTIEQPANALRVLTQQFTQLKRTIGTTFIPLLINVIPYLQATTELLTDMVSAFATLVGFKMPEWDADSWSGLENGADGVTGSIEEATEAAKELKRQTAGFDELNVLTANDGSGISADGGTSSWVNDLEIPSLWDDTVLDQIADKTTEIKENIGPIVDGVLALGLALLGLKLNDSVKNLLDNPKKWKSAKFAVALSLAVTSIDYAVDAGQDFANNDIKGGIVNALKSALGAGVSGAMVGGPAGAVAGVALDLAISLTGYLVEKDNILDQKSLEYYTTQFSSEVATARAKLEAAAGEVLEIQTNLSFLTGDLSAEDQAKFELAKSYVDKLYGLVDIYNEDPTNQTVLENIETTISDINSLSLENLQLSFDTVDGVVKNLDGTVLQTKSDALEMIKAIEDQAKLTVIATQKVQAELEGAKAKAAYESVVDPYLAGRADLKAEYSRYETLYNEAQKRYQEIGARSDWMNYIGEMTSLRADMSNYRHEMEAIEAAIADVDAKMAPYIDAYKKAGEKIEFLDTQLEKVKADIAGIDFDPATKEVTDFTKEMNKSFDALSVGMTAAKDSIAAVAKMISENGNVFDFKGSTSGGGGRFAVTISQYADGGFPTMGDLFIANEAGPELVGTIGGQTAVANNDQIVAGIANGVASANTAQNALLREQNNILLAILQKTGVVTLDGKMLDHSIEQYRSNKGASIMSGGVR